MTAGRVAVAVLTSVVLWCAASIGRATAVAYMLVYVAATLPGWPIGFALFGRRHAAGWIAGALFGYAITALHSGCPSSAGRPGGVTFSPAWTLVPSARGRCSVRLAPRRLTFPPGQGATRSLCAPLFCSFPLLVARPVRPIGESDAQGNRTLSRLLHRRLRLARSAHCRTGALFLSAEKTPTLRAGRFTIIGRIILLPAAVTGAGPQDDSPPIETYLAANGLSTGDTVRR